MQSKTLIGAGITYAHYNKPYGLTAIIMCPSHLVNKWKKEIEKVIPNGKAYIIKTIKDIQQLDNKIKNKYKRENSYLIMSKETAKFSYELYPTAIWSISKNAFVCPNCGKVLLKKVKVKGTRKNEYTYVPFDKLDFRNQFVFNEKCDECHEKLWSPLNKNADYKWLKIGSDWIYKSHLDDLINEMKSKKLTMKEKALLSKLINTKFNLDIGKETNPIKAPRKYSLSKYIKKYYKGDIDYLLADELHLYKAESKQGFALADLINASKKTIGLTGTLLNGYADSLFYILYRMFPKKMRAEGFHYSDCSAFMYEYGVVRKTSSYRLNGSGRRQASKAIKKRLPGISPLVFTKFLLEYTCFISLADIEEGGLPSYEEIPIPITMDEELRNAYERVHNGLIDACQDSGIKIAGSWLQSLSVYPDTPYDQPPIINPDTGEELIFPPELPQGLRNKENKLIELVLEKVNVGEKVLIYCEWTNRSDVMEKLNYALQEKGIYSDVLLSTDTSAMDREEYIDKKIDDGLEVLICNPKLVETGLDLLAFTNIIFYQIGYNVSTLRQASRRSYRLNQTKDIKVYFMYYEDTIQAQALSLMAGKLQASMAIEGKFSEEGLRAMSNNEDLMTQIANSMVSGMQDTIEINSFATIKSSERIHNETRIRKEKKDLCIMIPQQVKLGYLKNKPIKKLVKKNRGTFNFLKEYLSNDIVGF